MECSWSLQGCECDLACELYVQDTTSKSIPSLLLSSLQVVLITCGRLHIGSYSVVAGYATACAGLRSTLLPWYNCVESYAAARTLHDDLQVPSRDAYQRLYFFWPGSI